jgi:hypothetical protein
LYDCLIEANHEIWRQSRGKKGLPSGPIPEGKNPPAADDEKRAKREDKIPDFYWGFTDHELIEQHGGNARIGERLFFIECKCLGKTRKSGWNLNENYIENGVLRFIREEWGYAKGESTGAMVGYVQNMKLDDILQQVNNCAKKPQNAIPNLILDSGGWRINGTSKLYNNLTRNFVISDFRLQHFWIDLRSCYNVAAQPSQS